MSAAGRSGYWHIKDRWSTRAGEWVLFTLARGVYWLTRPVGLWTLGRLLEPLGAALALWVPGFRRRAEDNLELVWPELSPARRREIVAGAGRAFLRLMLEYARLNSLSKSGRLSTEGLHHLEAAIASGRGAVIVSAHFGNWEAVRLAAKRAGIDCGIIYRAFNNRYLDRFTLESIPCMGRPVLQKGPAGLRELIQHLSRGGVAMILVDQRNSGAPFLPFLGQPAETMTTAAEIARRTGAALIPAMARRDVAARGFEVRIEPAVTTESPEAAMREVNARIGAWVEETPEQWFWFHRRWRATRRSRAR